MKPTLFRSKKGITTSFIIGMMITLIAFVLISGTLVRFMSKAEGKEAEILCHDSIILRAKSVLNVDHALVDVQLKTVPVLCETIDKKIEGTREDLKRQFADQMARCWWMFGEGRYEEILHGSTLDILPSIMGTDELENQCFNCYTLLIDQNTIEGGPITSQEFTDFLATKKYAPKNISYLKYIQSYGGPGMTGVLTGSIDPRHAYGISILPVIKKEGKVGWIGIVGALVADVAAIGCVAATGGLCLPLAVPALTASTVVISNTALQGHLSSQSAPEELIQRYGAGIPLEEMFQEREVTSIYVAELETSEQFCGSGDISGE